MSLRAIDGFDHYNTTADMYSKQGILTWNLAYGILGNITIQNLPLQDGSRPYPRFGVGKYLCMGSDTFLNGNMMDMVAGGVGFAFWIQSSSTDTSYPNYSSVCGIEFYDTSIPPRELYQCGVYIANASGRIFVYDATKKMIATSAPGTVPLGVWGYLEIIVAVGAVGQVQIRLNNQPVPGVDGAVGDFLNSGTDVYPAVPANPIFSQCRLYNNVWSANFCVDDFHYVDCGSSDGGAYANNGFVGDSRVLTMYPSSDFAVSWNNPQMIYYDWAAVQGGDYTNWWTQGINANEIYWIYNVSQHTGRLARLATNLTGAAGGHVNMALYANVAATVPGVIGAPGRLITQGAQALNPAAGSLTFDVTSAGVDIVRGRAYWIAIWSDVALNLYGVNTYTQSVPASARSATYGPTFPDPAQSPGGWPYSAYGDVGFGMYALSNTSNVNENTFDGDDSYNSTSSVGAEDLFNCDPVVPTTLNILGVQVTGAYRKDDASVTTQMTQRVKSGSADSGGALFSPPSSWVYHSDVWVLDPQTGSNWTVTSVNTMQIGYKLES
jgi:hypothetical protein